MEGLFVGLMSGTSVDGIDAVAVEFSPAGAQLAASHSEPIDPDLKRAIIELCSPGVDEIERLGIVDRRLGLAFAGAVNNLLEQAGLASRQISAIGSHGQTVRHRPPEPNRPASRAYTLQLGDPSTIAEHTGITTVADFRRRDIAAGGQGAPLVPRFHQAVFSAPGLRRAILNIGGMANVSLLDGSVLCEGFDTGPGNVLLDAWVGEHTGHSYDHNGQWGAGGTVRQPLLTQCLTHPFLALQPPKSTGREAFNLAWLKEQLTLVGVADREPVDVQATLLEFTARTIATALARPEARPQEVYLCGGGAHHPHLRERIAQLLYPVPVATTTELGINPDWVEAAAFAWLARQCLCQQSGNHPPSTGASGERILGGIYAA